MQVTYRESRESMKKIAPTFRNDANNGSIVDLIISESYTLSQSTDLFHHHLTLVLLFLPLHYSTVSSFCRNKRGRPNSSVMLFSVHCAQFCWKWYNWDSVDRIALDNCRMPFRTVIYTLMCWAVRSKLNLAANSKLSFSLKGVSLDRTSSWNNTTYHINIKEPLHCCTPVHRSKGSCFYTGVCISGWNGTWCIVTSNRWNPPHEKRSSFLCEENTTAPPWNAHQTSVFCKTCCVASTSVLCALLNIELFYSRWLQMRY